MPDWPMPLRVRTQRLPAGLLTTPAHRRITGMAAPCRPLGGSPSGRLAHQQPQPLYYDRRRLEKASNRTGPPPGINTLYPDVWGARGATCSNRSRFARDEPALLKPMLVRNPICRLYNQRGHPRGMKVIPWLDMGLNGAGRCRRCATSPGNRLL